MRYLSLFSGIGGFELGIQKAYVDTINRTEDRKGEENKVKDAIERYRLESTPRQASSLAERRGKQLLDRLLNERTPTCVGYSEIDKYAIQIYQKHFPEHKNYGDITKINEKDLPDFDLLVGGFPCQSFSIAGLRKGFTDATRGTLFFDICRILKAKQSRLFLLENVKGLLSHDNGKTFSTIISTLDELGYDLQWQVLNSKNFGVPQNRERVFIIGHLRGTARPEVFPIQGNSKADFSGVSIIDGYNRKRSKEVGAVRQNMLNGGSLIDNNNSIRRPTHPTNIRRLTPLECCRLQGFQDQWTKYGLVYLTPEEYNRDYANDKKNNPIEILQSLQETIIEGEGKGRRFTEPLTFLKEKILQSGMYEKSVCTSLERQSTSTSREMESKAISHCDRVWEMWLDEAPRHSSQRQKLVEQLFVQLRGRLSEMSCKGTPKAKIVVTSDTQRYKTLGNAVTVNVIQAIINNLASN